MLPASSPTGRRRRGWSGRRGPAIESLVSADEAETAAFLDRHEVGLVVLAGYMRILSPEFVHRFSGRIMNVHPSLLPAFPGAHAVADAVEHGVRVTGVTVHLVDDEHVAADSGPIVLQEAMAVSYDDRAEDVTERLHEIEHRLLPRAVRLFSAGGIELARPACAREGASIWHEDQASADFSERQDRPGRLRRRPA